QRQRHRASMRRLRDAIVLYGAFTVSAAFVACGTDVLPPIPGGPVTDEAGLDPEPQGVGPAGRGATDASIETAAVDASTSDGADAAPATPVFVTLAERCKLINGRNLDDQSANQPVFHAN